ncbi:MAG: MBL fold metallo-hydrolase [Candidatus Krumholzibacteria bacterium]|nr:MBL fold metallo-hydrolase [Candidatus Krumholzibacteria bacterium]
MIAASLQSGSSGNCIYVETRDARILFDAGISGVQAERRLRSIGREMRDVDCLFISHDHSDHTSCAGVFSRKYGIPVRMTRKTLAALREGRASFGELSHFERGECIQIGQTVVETIPTPHDGADGVVFVVQDDRRRLGVLTDIGHVFAGFPELVAGLDGVFLESNYETRLLESGPYPAFLKARIRGPGGHLSNDESALLLERAFRCRLRWACLAHLSEQNNDPRTALRAHRRVLGDGVELCIAGRYEVSPILSL